MPSLKASEFFLPQSGPPVFFLSAHEEKQVSLLCSVNQSQIAEGVEDAVVVDVGCDIVGCLLDFPAAVAHGDIEGALFEHGKINLRIAERDGVLPPDDPGTFSAQRRSCSHRCGICHLLPHRRTVF